MASPKQTTRDFEERFRAHGRRIDALRRSSHKVPGWSATSGFSTQIAAIRRDHESARANLSYLASTPRTAADWKRLRTQLAEALDRMDEEIGALEHQRKTTLEPEVASRADR